MSDATVARNLEQGRLGSALSDSKSEADAQYTDRFDNIRKAAADAMAADATAETGGFSIPYNGIVTRIEVFADADIAADAADGVIITVSKRDAAGANKTTLGTFSTLAAAQNGLVKWIREAFALTNANVEVVKGGSITWEIAKPGAGKIAPILQVSVYILRTSTKGA